MKIVTYNVDGIRAALKKDLASWLLEQDADIICIQETKSQPEQVDLAAFEEQGYHAYWHSAVKLGYSGVLTLTKQKASNVVVGMGMDKYDNEGRVLRTDIGEWTVFNCYFPSGSSGEERHAFKMEFLHDFGPFIEGIKKETDHIIVVGDYNVVHQDIDIHNPKKNDKRSGCQPEEKAWLNNWFTSGFTDAFRFLNPEKIEYSWWSYRAGARDKNKGWRIDYISVSDTQQNRIKDAGHHRHDKHSDHCGLHMVID